MLKREWAEGGALLDLTVEGGKGNVIDGATMDELTSAVRDASSRKETKVIRIQGAGEHFSFGASVEEHAPAQVAGMLAKFHDLFRALDAAAIPTMAVVRGRCLGGGLELASWCTWIFASHDALFAQPEVRLAVFAPIASLVLPWRLGGGAALDLCCSGRTWTARQALERGLVTDVQDDPRAASDAFFLEHLAPRSAIALRYTERAARHALSRALREELPRLERQYLTELMATHDAPEGIAAFMERRSPKWEDR
jgi:cyclohexa-1,5-dienecarbonyl-CoA hydratase